MQSCAIGEKMNRHRKIPLLWAAAAAALCLSQLLLIAEGKKKKDWPDLCAASLSLFLSLLERDREIETKIDDLRIQRERFSSPPFRL